MMKTMDQWGANFFGHLKELSHDAFVRPNQNIPKPINVIKRLSEFLHTNFISKLLNGMWVMRVSQFQFDKKNSLMKEESDWCRQNSWDIKFNKKFALSFIQCWCL